MTGCLRLCRAGRGRRWRQGWGENEARDSVGSRVTRVIGKPYRILEDILFGHSNITLTHAIACP